MVNDLVNSLLTEFYFVSRANLSAKVLRTWETENDLPKKDFPSFLFYRCDIFSIMPKMQWGNILKCKEGWEKLWVIWFKGDCTQYIDCCILYLLDTVCK